MKKIISLCLVSAFIAASALMSSCSSRYDSLKDEPVGTYSEEYRGQEITVYNWGEYISDGAEGSLDVNKAFEKLTGIKVNYITYDSNEIMYSNVKSNAVSYDIVIPSDYMIARMLSEGLLQKIDFSKLDNYKYISDDYKDLYFDENNEYSVPYNVGMVGLIYNTKMVEEAPDSWAAMWDERYSNQILNFNNPRDAFAIAQFLLGIDVNSLNKEDWDRAAQKLKDQKSVRQGLVMDEVFDKMQGGNAAIAPYYAGDFLTMHDVNEDLAFVYPKEGTNIFVDSVCIPSNAKNYGAALMYINFLMEPEVALANAEYICYASPNEAVISNDEYTFKGNEILYPSEEKMPKTEYFHDIDSEIRSYYEQLWEEVRS